MIIEKSKSAAQACSAPLLTASLHEIALTAPDVARTAAFYEDALGYRGQWNDGRWSGTLSQRRLSISEGPGNSLDQAIFAVAGYGQLEALRHRLGEANVPLEHIDAADLASEAIGFRDPDGNRLAFGVTAVAPHGSSDDLPARLQHVVFATDQLGAMLDFYRRVLGFAPADYVREGGSELTSVFLRCSEEHHSVAIFRAPRRRLDHLCYEVADWTSIRDWADRFAARHITLRWGPGRHGPGNNLFLFVNDPDGNWLEFSAELERIVEPRPAGEWVHEERTLNSWGAAILRS